MDWFAGVIAIETSVAGVIVMVVDPLTEPEVAVMVAVPTPDVVTSPVADTDAVAVDEELQIAVLVRSCVDPSL